jgi:arginine deiminase
MKIEQNTISRDWTVLYKGRRFFVNFTESDGQTLALCNRDKWQIHKQTEDAIEELNAYVLNKSSPEEREQAEVNTKIIDKLIGFCIRNLYNGFMQEVKEELEEQSKILEG